MYVYIYILHKYITPGKFLFFCSSRLMPSSKHWDPPKWDGCIWSFCRSIHFEAGDRVIQTQTTLQYSAQWGCRKSQLITINHYEISIKHCSYHYKPKINRYTYPSLNYSYNIKWYVVEDLPMCLDVFVKIYRMRQVGKSPTYQPKPKLYKFMLAYN